MYHRFDRRSPRGALKAFVVSVLLHLAAGLVLVLMLIGEPQEVEVVEEAEQEFEVVAIVEEDATAEVDPIKEVAHEDLVEVVEVIEVVEVVAVVLEEPDEDGEEEEPAPVPQFEPDLHAVVQDTNEEAPEEAEYISDLANTVDEETRAEETSMDEVADTSEENAQDMADDQVPDDVSDEDRMVAELEVPELVAPSAAIAPPVLAPPPVEVAPLERAEVEDDWSDDYFDDKLADIDDMEQLVVEDQHDPSPRPPLDPRSLFNPDFEKYEEMYGSRDDTLRDRERHDPTERRLLKDWKDNEKAMRASLENFIDHVKPGNHTSVNAHSAVYASYLARIHRHIHAGWAYGFIHNANNHFPANHPLNRMSLNAVIELVIDGSSGELEEVNIVRSSGELTYDAEAILVARRIGRHGNAPKEIVSPDGRVYIHWNFWRDNRQCGPFGASVFVLDS